MKIILLLILLTSCSYYIELPEPTEVIVNDRSADILITWTYKEH